MPHRDEAAKRTRLERIVRRLTSELLLTGPKISGQGSQTWASCTERVLCAREFFTSEFVHRRSAAAFKLHGVCGRRELRVALVPDSPDHDYKNLIWRRLTPELSRTAARHGGVVNATT